MPVQEQLNLTPFAAGLGLCQDRDGREVAVGVVKATFRLDASGRVEPAPPGQQLPVFLADQHHGNPASTSVRYASDVVPTRRGTDVAVVGHAYGRGKASVEAGFRVGTLEKMLVVTGPRVWVGGIGSTIAGPVAFEKMPVRYELAYGGTYEEAGQGPVGYPDNPVGVGFAKALPDRAPLPNVEYRDSRFTSPRGRLRPAGLGFVPPGWRQRARFAGTFDQAWARTRSPLLPADLDERFYNAVPEDQVLQPKLAGGERMLLRNLHPEAETLVLELPRLSFRATFHVRDRTEQVPMVADTLLVEPDLGRLALAFRASLPLGDDAVRLRNVVFRPVREAAPAAAGAARRA